MTLLSNGGGGIGWWDDANDGSVDVRCYDVATQRPVAPPLTQGSGYGLWWLLSYMAIARPGELVTHPGRTESD